MNRITTAQIDNVDKGKLQINVTSDMTSYPISEAKISITYTGVPESPIEELTTDSSGQTEVLELDTPPLEYSLNPTIEYQPYSEYTLNVSAPGFERSRDTSGCHRHPEYYYAPDDRSRTSGRCICHSRSHVIWRISA